MCSTGLLEKEIAQQALTELSFMTALCAVNRASVIDGMTYNPLPYKGYVPP